MTTFSRPSKWLRSPLLFAVLLTLIAVSPNFSQDAHEADPPILKDEIKPLPIPFELVYTKMGSTYRNLRHALEQNDSNQAMTIVQAILDADEDSSIANETTPIFSIKKLAHDYVESLPADELKKYQERWEIDAEVLLDSAEKSANPREYLLVLERYYFTHSGFRAADWLATRALDFGRYRSAARLWNDLIDSPVHSRTVGPSLLLKAAVANRLAGHGERAAELMQRVQQSPAGQKLSNRLELYLTEESATPVDSESDPLPQSWTYSLKAQLSDDEQEFFEHWRQAQWSEDRAPLSLPRQSVVSGNLLCVRDLSRFLMFDVQTGKLLGETPLNPSIEELTIEYRNDGYTLNEWDQFSARSEFLPRFVWNTLRGGISTNGGFAYVLESDTSWIEKNRRGALPQSEFYRNSSGIRGQRRGDDPVPINRLVAMPLSAGSNEKVKEITPAWVAGETGTVTEGYDGSFFLSVPLALDGFLYTLMEQDDALRLACLDPPSGKLLWTQGIAFPPLTIFEDSDRRFRGCTLVDGGDVIVMTTQVGLVAAIDPIRKTLEWVYYIGDHDARRGFGMTRHLTDQSFGYLGFLDRPFVQDGRVVLLPRQSQFVHCLDLESGELLWKTPRNKSGESSETNLGDEYLAGASGGTIMIAGSLESRGLALSSGEQLWTVSHPRIAGIGVQREAHYLLALQNSRVLRVDLRNGSSRELPLDHSAVASSRDDSVLSGYAGDSGLQDKTAPLPAFGHLELAGDRLISVGVNELRGLPEPAAQLRSLNQKLTKDETLPVREQLQRALLLPEADSVERDKLLFELSRSELDPDLQQLVQQELKENLFELLHENRDDYVAAVERIHPLLKSDEDRARLLIGLSHVQMQQLDVEGVLQSLSQLIELDTESLFPVPDDSQLSVSTGSWIRFVWDWAMTNLPAGTHAKFESLLQNQLRLAINSPDPKSRDRLLKQFPGLPQLDSVRLQLAVERIENRQFHEAEMLLMTVAQQSSGTAASRDAAFELARLWVNQGQPAKAASLLTNWKSQSDSSGEAEFQELLTHLEHKPEFSTAWQNRQAVETPPRQVLIEPEHPGIRQRMISEAYGNYFRIYPTPQDCDFDLLAKRTNRRSEFHHLNLVSRSRGEVLGVIDVPVRGTSSAATEDAVVGHFFPFGSSGQLRGISLIDHPDNLPIWTRSFLDPEMNDPLYVGPFGPQYVSFRNEETVLVLDSRDGRVLWRRDRLEPQKSLNGNPRLNLFGDDRVLVRHASNESRYEIYRTFTGRSVVPAKKLPRLGLLGSVGRRLVSIRYEGQNSGVDESSRKPSVSVFDTESGAEVWSTPYWHQQCCAVIKDQLVVITGDRQLKVLDLATMEELFSVPLTFDECAGVNMLQYFFDGTNHYVNIRRSDDNKRAVDPQLSERFSQFVPGAFLPTIDVQGLLIAVDAKTRQRRWDQILPACSVLQFPHERVPFLTTLSWKIQQRVPNVRRLQVEALSLETGDRLAASDNFVPLDQHTQMIQSWYDAKSGVLELNGPLYRASIRFKSKWDDFLNVPGPF